MASSFSYGCFLLAVYSALWVFTILEVPYFIDENCMDTMVFLCNFGVVQMVIFSGMVDFC